MKWYRIDCYLSHIQRWSDYYSMYYTKPVTLHLHSYTVMDRFWDTLWTTKIKRENTIMVSGALLVQIQSTIRVLLSVNLITDLNQELVRLLNTRVFMTFTQRERDMSWTIKSKSLHISPLQLSPLVSFGTLVSEQNNIR